MGLGISKASPTSSQSIQIVPVRNLKISGRLTFSNSYHGSVVLAQILLSVILVQPHVVNQIAAV